MDDFVVVEELKPRGHSVKTHDVAPDPICLRPNSTVFGSNVASSPPAVTLILLLLPSICGECLLE